MQHLRGRIAKSDVRIKYVPRTYVPTHPALRCRDKNINNVWRCRDSRTAICKRTSRDDGMKQKFCPREDNNFGMEQKCRDTSYVMVL